MDPITGIALAAVVAAGAGIVWFLQPGSPDRKTSVRPMPSTPADPMVRPEKVKESPEAFARRHGIDPAVLQAFVDVESAGKTGTSHGPLFRFEVHHLLGYAKGASSEAARVAQQHFNVQGPKPWQGHRWRESPTSPWRALHLPVRDVGWEKNQAEEYAAFRKAWELLTPLGAEDLPFRAASWGVGQVLGRYYHQLGYRSAEEMFNDARDSEAAQVAQMLAYVERVKPQLVPALQRRDWRTIAKLYNGSGNVDAYAPKFEAAYRKIKSRAVS